MQVLQHLPQEGELPEAELLSTMSRVVLDVTEFDALRTACAQLGAQPLETEA